MSKIEKILAFDYGAAHSAYWIEYAAIGSFASVFLLARGYTNSAIGTILAIVNILSIFIQMFVANYLDQSKKATITGTVNAMCFIMMAMNFVQIFAKAKSWPLTIAFVIMLSLCTSQHPLINTLLVKFNDTGHNVPYGVPRSCGSFAFAVTTAILGKILENNVEPLPYLNLAFTILLVLVMIMVSKHYKMALADKKEVVKTEEEEVVAISFMEFIKNNKYFMIACVGAIGLFFSQGLFNSFCLQICTDVGGTSQDMGNVLGIAAIFEIPAFIGFDFLIKKFKSKTILKCSAIAFGMKVLFAYLAKSVVLVYCAQFFHMLSFGLFMPSILRFVDEIMSKQEAVRGQSMATLVLTAGCVLASLVGGVVIDNAGVKTLLLIGAAISFAGAALFIPMIEKSSKVAH